MVLFLPSYFFFIDYIEELAMNTANYMIENNVAVRQTAKEFEILMSTVHTIRTK